MAQLECLVDSTKKDDLAVIFIHGLNGDARGTWMMDEKEDSTLWPRWLASDVDCSVWVLGYDAKLSSWQDNAMPLPDQGDSVLETLATEEGLKNRPLLLIGHSMGGLVIKTLIHHGRTKGVARYESVVKRIRGVSFVATPHNGSQLATLAQYMAFLLRTNPQVGNMQNHDAHLRSLNQQFLAYFHAHDTCVAVRTFAERKPVQVGVKFFKPIKVLVVDANSSEPHVPHEIAVPLPEDHISICKLANKGDQLYKSLLAFIKEDVLPKSQPLQQSDVETVGESRIHSDRLPTVKGGFFGRTAELQLLNDAWANTTTRIIQFIAPGGTGKTKLLRHWLDHTTDIPVLIAWSFYSQGSSEDKQTSATPFFSHAFAKLGSTRERFASEEDKGDHLAELLHGKRYVLVLDGLEPLQHGGATMRGELKDRAIRQLLRQLVRHPCGLCIITTRIALHELSDRDAPTVIRHDLQNLTAVDGIQLLQSLGVTGSAAELGKAVREYGGHALALSLLGNVLRLRHQGDVRKRDTLKALVKAKGNQDSRHAFKVMQAYAEWFAGEPELALLHLLGLFDHPIGQDVLQMLWDAQIPHLTAGIDEDEWLEAIASLREEHHLLSQHDGGGDLDCHPLIREYFGGQLKTQQPQAWQQAHERLYEYYKALPEKLYGKFLPDTLDEMQPLFSAVAHGCAAGLHQQALEQIYWTRIQRGQAAHMTKKLGLFNDELSVLANFFISVWHKPVPSLVADYGTVLVHWAAFTLRGLGRCSESMEAMQISANECVQNSEWKNAAIEINNISELHLALGNIDEAISNARLGVNYADESKDLFFRMYARTTLANALYQAGQTFEATTLFQASEKLQENDQALYPLLYSIQGFRYCCFLLDQGSVKNVAMRAEYSSKIAKRDGQALDIALSSLMHTYIYLRKNDADEAIIQLQEAGSQEFLPLGLLARAALHRHTRDFARARQDLQEVFDIADGSGMRLHLTDYHLEMARLLVAEEENPPQSPFCKGGSQEDARSAVPPFEKGGLGGISLQAHIEAAAKLINETGYHRRDTELAQLQAAVT